MNENKPKTITEKKWIKQFRERILKIAEWQKKTKIKKECNNKTRCIKKKNINKSRKKRTFEENIE